MINSLRVAKVPKDHSLNEVGCFLWAEFSIKSANSAAKQLATELVLISAPVIMFISVFLMLMLIFIITVPIIYSLIQ